MWEQKPKTSKIILLLVIALAVTVGIQTWYILETHQKLTQLRAENPDAAWGIQPQNSPAMKSHSPTVDKWFQRPFDSDTWDPFQEMQQMRDHINRMFGDAFGRFNRSSRFGHLFRSESFTPSIDVREEKDRFVVRVDLPGAKSENLDVKLENRQLTVSGTITRQEESGSGKILQHERQSGTFSRTITLPSPVRTNKMESRFDSGILIITIPKA